MDSILEIGYLKGRGTSHDISSKYMIRFLTEDDLQHAMKLQEIVLRNLQDSEIYHPASQDILKEYLSKKNFAIGVEIDKGLIGFALLHIPGVEQDNLGRDIGIAITDLDKVAHLQYSVVHPDYRGNFLQSKLAKYLLNVIKDIGCWHVLCTISPKNYYSLRNAFQMGFIIKEIKEKYDGLLRCILYKNISVNANPTWRNVVTIKSSDIERQKKILSEGFVGFDVSNEANNFLINYGKRDLTMTFDAHTPFMPQ